MNAPAVILFDLDDVLARYDRTARVDHLALRTGASAATVWNALFASGLEAESDLGHWLPEPYVGELERRLGLPVSQDDCIAARAQAMQLDHAVCARARELARQARCAILTNNGFFLREHLAAICPGLFPQFADQVYCSAEFGVCKPDPEIFRRCMHRLEVPAYRALFIDDNMINVQGAIAAGLDAIHFTDLAALGQALAARGLPQELNNAS